MKDTDRFEFLKDPVNLPDGVKNREVNEGKLVGDFEEDSSEVPDLRDLAEEQGVKDSLPPAFECDAKACLKERDEYLAMSGLPTGNEKVINFLSKRVNKINDDIAYVQRLQKQIEESKDLMTSLLTELGYEEIKWVKEGQEDGYVRATRNHSLTHFGHDFI